MRPGNANLKLGPEAIRVGKAALTRARSLGWLVTRGTAPSPGGLRILFYHRITADSDPLAVRPDRFRAQIEWLRAVGYQLVDVATAARLLSEGRAEGVIAISFDDGYRDVVDNAGPVLEACDATASVFVVPGAVSGDTRFTWYTSQPPLLSWDEICRLDAASPFRFEAHSLTHPNLTALDDVTARREIFESKSVLEDRLRRTVDAFSYPAGLHGPRERRLAAAAGFKVAVTCDPGLNMPGADPMALRRTALEAADRCLDFRAKVGGAHDRPLPLQSLYRRARYGSAQP